MTGSSTTRSATGRDTQDARFALALEQLGAALARLAGGYEANPAEREDLLQEIHLRVWRSLGRFDGRCSLRTWVYRVAHNTAADHVAKARRRQPMVGLDHFRESEVPGGAPSPEAALSEHQALAAIHRILHRLRPLDRQVMLLYLEGETAATIADVTGLSAGAVATRVHRAKRLLAASLAPGDRS